MMGKESVSEYGSWMMGTQGGHGQGERHRQSKAREWGENDIG